MIKCLLQVRMVFRTSYFLSLIGHVGRIRSISKSYASQLECLPCKPVVRGIVRWASNVNCEALDLEIDRIRPICPIKPK